MENKSIFNRVMREFLISILMITLGTLIAGALILAINNFDIVFLASVLK